MTKVTQIARIAVVSAVLMSGGFAFSAWASDSATYAYDALGRLTTVTYANGTTITYSYDAAGNRTAAAVACGGSGC